MNSFIKKMNTLPLNHQSKEPFIHKPFLAKFFETFHETYRSLHLDSITYKMEKDKKQGLLQLEKNTEKCLVVVDSDNILKGTLTDGDIRSAMLRGSDINSKTLSFDNTPSLISVLILDRLRFEFLRVKN